MDVADLQKTLYCPECGQLMERRVDAVAPDGIRRTYTGCVACNAKIVRLLRVAQVLPALAAGEGG